MGGGDPGRGLSANGHVTKEVSYWGDVTIGMQMLGRGRGEGRKGREKRWALILSVNIQHSNIPSLGASFEETDILARGFTSTAHSTLKGLQTAFKYNTHSS